MRQIIFHLLLVFVPFILYWSYVAFVLRKKEETGGTWDDAPIARLLGSGLVLAIVSLVFVALNQGEKAGSVYEPAKVEDGELKPGRVKELNGGADNAD